MNPINSFQPFFPFRGGKLVEMPLDNFVKFLGGYFNRVDNGLRQNF